MYNAYDNRVRRTVGHECDTTLSKKEYGIVVKVAKVSLCDFRHLFLLLRQPAITCTLNANNDSRHRSYAIIDYWTN